MCGGVDEIVAALKELFAEPVFRRSCESSRPWDARKSVPGPAFFLNAEEIEFPCRVYGGSRRFGFLDAVQVRVQLFFA